MFRIDAGRTQRYCDGMSRRCFLQVGVAGMASAGLATIARAAQNGDPNAPRNYSYSMNWLVCQAKDNTRGGTAPLIGIRLGSVRQSSDKIMWYEELAPNDTWNIMQLHIADIPSARHGTNAALNAIRDPNSKAYNYAGLGNVCFFDGHVVLMSPKELLDTRNSKLHRPLVQGDPS